MKLDIGGTKVRRVEGRREAVPLIYEGFTSSIPAP